MGICSEQLVYKLWHFPSNSNFGIPETDGPNREISFRQKDGTFKFLESIQPKTFRKRFSEARAKEKICTSRCSNRGGWAMVESKGQHLLHLKWQLNFDCQLKNSGQNFQ
ncbi:hypothetical protein P3S68_009958 [Capsicum galapagoense]